MAVRRISAKASDALIKAVALAAIERRVTKEQIVLEAVRLFLGVKE